MTHRVVITNSLRTAVQNPLVQSELSTNQKSRLQSLIPQTGEIDTDNIDRVLSCIGRIYAKDD